MKNKIISLLQDEKFLSKLNDASNPEEIQKVFKSEGIDISLDKAEIVSEALESANERIRNGEEITPEELEEVGGGKSLLKKSLEFVIMTTVIALGVSVAKKVKDRGGLNKKFSSKLSGAYQKGVDLFERVGNRVADWLAQNN